MRQANKSYRRMNVELSLQVESDVWAAYYFNCSLLHTKLKNFAEFYKSCLLYLCYVPLEDLSLQTKQVNPFHKW